VTFVDDEDDDSQVSLQRAIDSLTIDVTQLVRASEAKLRELSKYQSEDSRCDEQSKFMHGYSYSQKEYTYVTGTATQRYNL
jgi:hypothetical protein